MISTRQNENNEQAREEPKTLDINSNSDTKISSSTASIQNSLMQNFVMIDAAEAPLAALNESMLIRSPELSNIMKLALGIKSSAHDVEIVSYNPHGCDIVFSPARPHDYELNQLPGNSKACYIFTADKKLYYADKLLKLCTLIPLGYDLAETSSGNLKEKVIEFESTTEGIRYRVVGLDNFEKVGVILWADLQKEWPSFPKDKKEILAQKDKSLSVILKISSAAGYTTPLIPSEIFESLCKNLSITPLEHADDKNFICLIENADFQILEKITLAVKHMHGMCFYKKNSLNSVMSPLEAANSVAYQFLGTRYFPTCYAITNEKGQYTGVASKLLPGFKPNRDKPLSDNDLIISSLENMIVSRSEYELCALNKVIELLKDQLIPLLGREIDGNQSYASQFWGYATNTINWYVGSPYCAIQVKPALEKFLQLNETSVTFGVLDSLRNLLINREALVLLSKNKYVATEHKHEKELSIISEAAEQLSLILLNEIAIFIKNFRKINRDLENAWVDIEAELANPNSPYKNLVIQEGLVTSLKVPLSAVLNYRNNIGLGIGLTAGYFNMDRDRHARNIASNGLNIDGDEAAYPLVYRFKKPGSKPGSNDFIMDVDDFLKFPNLTKAYFRYWPTQASRADVSVDHVLSAVNIDLTMNYFSEGDAINYKKLEISPVFNFQKYVQLILDALMSKEMYITFAELHIPDKLLMLNDAGDITAPLPLLDENGKKQDVRTKWIELFTNRSLEARELAKKLLPVQKILERHSDLVLEMIQESFELFLQDKKWELNDQAFALLKEAVGAKKIEQAFYDFMGEVVLRKLPGKVSKNNIGFFPTQEASTTLAATNNNNVEEFATNAEKGTVMKK